MKIEFDRTVRQRAQYCPSIDAVESSGPVASFTKCVGNCMPCDKVMQIGATACLPAGPVESTILGGSTMSKSCNGVTIDAGGRGGHNSVTTKAFSCNNIEYCCAHVCYGGTNSADCGNEDFCGCQKGYWSTYTTATADGSTIPAGSKQTYEGRTERSAAHKAACRCVTLSVDKAVSICQSGSCIDESSKICDSSYGCSGGGSGCDTGKCTCKPKDVDVWDENTITFVQCQAECTRVNMVIPFSNEGIAKAKGTGCGIDIMEMWVSSPAFSASCGWHVDAAGTGWAPDDCGKGLNINY